MITNFNNLSHTSEDLFLRYVSGDISVAYVLYQYGSLSNLHLANFSTIYVSYTGNSNLPAPGGTSYVYIHGGTNFQSRYRIGAATFIADTALTASASAFLSCYALEYLSLPNLTTMNLSFCYHCDNLKQVFMPALTVLRTYAFGYCAQLSSININNVTALSGTSIFYNCQNLHTLYLPNLSTIATAITGFASNCSKLESVYFLNSTRITGTPTYVRTISTAFKNTPITNSTYLGYYGSIYVPSALLTDYQTAAYWSAFADRYVGV